MQSHIANSNFADEYEPGFAQQNVDITANEGGVEVIQIHVGSEVLCNRDNHVII